MTYYLVSEQNYPTRRYRARHHRHAAEIHARRRHGRYASAERVSGEPEGNGIWHAYVPFQTGGRTSRGNPYRVAEDNLQVTNKDRGDLSSYNW